MSPTQKKLLTYGVPIVAGIALLVWWQSRQSSSSAPTGTTTTGTPTDTASLSDLATFENTVTGEIASLASGITSQPAPSVAKPAAATPTNPYPVGVDVGTSGEVIVQAQYVPGLGYLDLTSEGGVYTSSGIGLSGSAFKKGTFRSGGLAYDAKTGVLTETDTAGKKFSFKVTKK